MSIEFICKECKTHLRLDPKDAGNKVRCPHCGMIQAGPDWHPPERPQDDHTAATKRPGQETAYLGTPTFADAGQDWLLKTPDGKIYGPVTRQTLDEWSNQGRVSTECYLKQNEETQWQKAEVLMPHVAEMNVIRTPASSVSTEANEPHTTRRLTFGLSDEPRSNHAVWILSCALLGFFSEQALFSLIAVVWGLVELKAKPEETVEKRQSAMIIWALIIAAISLVMASSGPFAFLGR